MTLNPDSGVLSCLDGYMNIALEQTEEHVNGTVTNRYGDAFIRGNNGSTVPFALLLADDFSHSTLHISCRTLIKHCRAYCKIVKLHSDLHISNASVGLRHNGARLLAQSLRAGGPWNEARYLQSVNIRKETICRSSPVRNYKMIAECSLLTLNLIPDCFMKAHVSLTPRLLIVRYRESSPSTRQRAKLHPYVLQLLSCLS